MNKAITECIPEMSTVDFRDFDNQVVTYLKAVWYQSVVYSILMQCAYHPKGERADSM